jgi:hypothetical protein
MKKILWIFLLITFVVVSGLYAVEWTGNTYNFMNSGGRDVELYFTTSSNQGKIAYDGTNDRMNHWDATTMKSTLTVDGASTLTGAAAINGKATFAAGMVYPTKTVTTTAEALLTAADCGKTVFLNHASTGIDVFLPVPSNGCYFKIIVIVAFADDHTINTNAGANILIGHINEIDDVSAGVSDDNADIITLVDTTELVGDFCEMISNGTSWYFSCTVGIGGGMTTGTT